MPIGIRGQTVQLEALEPGLGASSPGQDELCVRAILGPERPIHQRVWPILERLMFVDLVENARESPLSQIDQQVRPAPEMVKPE